MKNIVIFASGNGSNAQRIAEYFADNEGIQIKRIYSNRKDAYVLTRAHNLHIESFSFNRNDLYESNLLLEESGDNQQLKEDQDVRFARS